MPACGNEKVLHLPGPGESTVGYGGPAEGVVEVALQYGPRVAAAGGADQFQLGDLAYAHSALVQDGGPVSFHGGGAEQAVAGAGVDQVGGRAHAGRASPKAPPSPASSLSRCRAARRW